MTVPILPAETAETLEDLSDTPASELGPDLIELRIVVPAECRGWRLDHFLKRRIGRMSRTRIQSIIVEQIFFADGRRARPSSVVRAGETILLRRPAPVEPGSHATSRSSTRMTASSSSTSPPGCRCTPRPSSGATR